jgi:hypothetical protein
MQHFRWLQRSDGTSGRSEQLHSVADHPAETPAWERGGVAATKHSDVVGDPIVASRPPYSVGMVGTIV